MYSSIKKKRFTDVELQEEARKVFKADEIILSSEDDDSFEESFQYSESDWQPSLENSDSVTND